MKTATSEVTVRQLTVRIPRDLYKRAQLAARARRTSVSALVRELLEQLDRADRERELERAYELLGQDPKDAIEPFFEAQAQVARRG
jgi:Ribbon-helix-helix protein, copG family